MRRKKNGKSSLLSWLGKDENLGITFCCLSWSTVLAVDLVIYYHFGVFKDWTSKMILVTRNFESHQAYMNCPASKMRSITPKLKVEGYNVFGNKEYICCKCSSFPCHLTKTNSYRTRISQWDPIYFRRKFDGIYVDPSPVIKLTSSCAIPVSFLNRLPPKGVDSF